MAPLSSQMAPQMLQNGHQNVSPKAPRTQNAECEQIILFAMFQAHFGPPKRLENEPFFFQKPAKIDGLGAQKSYLLATLGEYDSRDIFFHDSHHF